MNKRIPQAAGSTFRCGPPSVRTAITVLLLLVSLAPPLLAAGLGQRQFITPGDAVAALVAAVRAGSTSDLIAIFGPQSGALVNSGDSVADRNGRERFVASYDQEHALVVQAGGKVVLVLGKDRWPFPIPLVRTGRFWRFDTAAGIEEIVDRRIGRNELNAIQVCRAYVDAQREYASRVRSAEGSREYAQHFMSRPNQHDGLYWPAKTGEEPSPMGALIVLARDEGYGAARSGTKREPYHGYYYRILKRQGPDAPGGAHNYMVGSRMIGGFALVAFPARYGVSGVMTFVVNQDGVVYQKDLGPDTERIARQMREYDPGTGWKPD